MNVNTETFPRRHRITVEEFHRMGEASIFSEDDRVELIEGEIIDMAPIGTKHAETVRKLIRILAGKLPSQALLDVQNPVLINSGNEPQPDVTVVRNRSYIDAHPGPEDVLLLIEVADSSLTYDRSVKIPLYARHGILEVWLVDLENRAVEVFREPSADGYRKVRRYHPGERLKSLALSEIVVDLAELLG